MVWYNPAFLKPNTFINFGDMMFSLNPHSYYKVVLYAWNTQGLGYQNILPFDWLPVFLVHILSSLHIPLWVINRLWVILPIAILGWSVYYLFLSITEGRYAKIAGVIASTFAMLCPIPPVYTFQYIGLTGFPLVLGTVIRVIHADRWSFKQSLLITLGVIFLFFSPRYLYLTILVVSLYSIIAFILNKKITYNQIKFFLATAILVILGSALILLPFIQFIITSGGRAMEIIYKETPKGYDTGLNLWFQYNGWVNPLWVLRLFTKNPSHPLIHFMSIPYISFLSLVMPIYAFACLILTRDKRAMIIAFISIFLIVIAISPAYALLTNLFLFLWNHLPGFSIFKTPVFFIDFLSIIYALFTGLTTKLLLDKIDKHKGYFVNIKFAKFILVFIIFLLISFVYGGGLLVGISPKDTFWGRVIYVNHTPSIRIPNEYYTLPSRISVRNNGASSRMLNLPWTMGGYIPYTWWHYFNMPEVVNFFSPIPVEGSSYPPEDDWLTDIDRYISENKTQDLLNIFHSYLIRYILVHKDYFTIVNMPFEPDKKLKVYKKFFDEHKDLFQIIDDNKFFALFKVNI